MPFFNSFHLTNVRTKGDEMFPLHVDLKLILKLVPKGGFYSERAGEFVISPNRRTKLFS